MIKKVLLLSSLSGALVLSGCATYLPNGIIYTGVEGAPTSEQTNPSTTANKVGKACAISILGLVAVGDMTVKKAAKEGGIAEIASVEYSNQNILGAYGKYCTIVHGS